MSFEGSAVNPIGCSFRSHEFNIQHSHGGLQLPVIEHPLLEFKHAGKVLIYIKYVTKYILRKAIWEHGFCAFYNETFVIFLVI